MLQTLVSPFSHFKIRGYSVDVRRRKCTAPRLPGHPRILRDDRGFTHHVSCRSAWRAMFVMLDLPLFIGSLLDPPKGPSQILDVRINFQSSRISLGARDESLGTVVSLTEDRRRATSRFPTNKPCLGSRGWSIATRCRGRWARPIVMSSSMDPERICVPSILACFDADKGVATNISSYLHITSQSRLIASQFYFG